MPCSEPNITKMKNLLALVAASLLAFTSFSQELVLTNVTYKVHYELETNWSYQTNYNAVAYGYTSGTNKIVDGYDYIPMDYYIQQIVVSNNFVDVTVEDRTFPLLVSQHQIACIKISWNDKRVYTTNYSK